MAALPLHKREEILELRKAKLTYDEIAEIAGVGRASVSRLLRHVRETNSILPKPPGGGNYSLIADDVAGTLLLIVDQRPDATVEELRIALEAQAKISTSRSAVQRALHRLGLSFKKKASRPPSVSAPKRRLGATSSQK